MLRYSPSVSCRPEWNYSTGVCFRSTGGRRWVWGGIKGLRLIVPIWKGANGRPSQLGIWNPRGAPGPGRTMAPPLLSRSASSCRNLRPTTRTGGSHLHRCSGHPVLLNGHRSRVNWEKFTWKLLEVLWFRLPLNFSPIFSLVWIQVAKKSLVSKTTWYFLRATIELYCTKICFTSQKCKK